MRQRDGERRRMTGDEEDPLLLLLPSVFSLHFHSDAPPSQFPALLQGKQRTLPSTHRFKPLSSILNAHHPPTMTPGRIPPARATEQQLTLIEAVFTAGFDRLLFSDEQVSMAASLSSNGGSQWGRWCHIICCQSTSTSLLKSGLSCATLFSFFSKLGLTVGNWIVLLFIINTVILKVKCVTFKKQTSLSH